MANYSIKQHNATTNGSGTQTTVTVVFTSAQTAGGLNVVAVGWNDITRTISSVSDNINGAYTNAAVLTRKTTVSQAVYYRAGIAAASASANTVTVTFNAAASITDIRIAEFASTNGSTWVVDQTASAGTSSTTPSSGNTAATTNANDLVYGAITTVSLANAGSGYTAIETTSNGDAEEWKESTVTGVQAATFTDSAGNQVVQVVAFNASSSSKALAGTCQAKAVNLGVLQKALSGTCQAKAVNTGKLSRLLSGTCVLTCVNTGVLSRFLLGTCTVHSTNTGVLKATKPLSGTCVSHSVNTGVFASTKPLSGTCVTHCANTGKISRFILGTCTARSASTGVLASSKLLSGTCQVNTASTGKLSRLISGSCLIHSVNSGSFTANRLMVGACVTVSSSTGALQSYKFLIGTCAIQSANTGLLSSTAFSAVCIAKAVCSGSLSLLYGLYIYSRETVTVQTMNANQVKRIMPPGAFLALPVNMIPAPPYDWTTQNLEIHGYTVGTVDIRPVWYVTPQTQAQLARSAAILYYNTIIAKDLVKSFTFADANWGSLTTGNKDVLLQQLVEGVNAILVSLCATMLNVSGTCIAKSNSTGLLGQNILALIGTCIVSMSSSGVLMCVKNFSGTCVVTSFNTGVLL